VSDNQDEPDYRGDHGRAKESASDLATAPEADLGTEELGQRFSVRLVVFGIYPYLRRPSNADCCTTKRTVMPRRALVTNRPNAEID
jgi:hypothetical protein